MHASAADLAGVTALAACAFVAGTKLKAGAFVRLAAFADVALLAWALRLASSPGAALVTAPVIGVCAGLLAGRPLRLRRVAGWGSAAALLLVLARYGLGREANLGLGAILALPAPGRLRFRTAWVSLAGGLALVMGGLAAFAYLGASTPAAGWFGGGVTHGPRDRNEVALTFDDGPDVEYTLQVASILDSYSVKGTFFVVGKALAARPDIARELLARGEVLGNHSYHHDAWSWLRPDYPEIGMTRSVFQTDLGVCPALFRPPHGMRTPFMARKAAEAGMTTVLWDVSAADWSTSDGELVAQRILSKVKPGSIILLHDGLDGKLAADRSVLLTALPLVLDGLRARGLRPVTVPELLGVPATVPCRGP